ncbi:MAG: thiamine phosphate synthase [Terriglobales bacterium]|jgi:thiamine-phosphate pyrophosphorylase
MLLYYITDRSQFPGGESARRRALLDKITAAAQAGVDYIQLREKDLSTRELQLLAVEAVALIREQQRGANSKQRTATCLLINSRSDIALAACAGGVHLRSDDISASTVRCIWKEALTSDSRLEANSPVIAVSCHSPSEVSQAEKEGADFAVFAPVFEKKTAPLTRPQGLTALGEACKATIPVLALGGITLQNASSCIEAGAAGVAGIRLFQENRIAEVVRSLRALTMRQI